MTNLNPRFTDVIQGWACTDCIMLYANGEKPEDWSEEEIEAWLARIEKTVAGTEVAVGGKHESDCPNVDEDGNWVGVTSCGCEEIEFSWSSCDLCRSPLGGSRHAVTFFHLKES